MIQECQGVPTGAGMSMIEMFGRDGDKFAFIGGSAGGFSKPGDESGPEDIGLAFHHALDLVADSVVVAHRDLPGEIAVIPDIGKAEFLADFGVFPFLDKGFEGGVLELVNVFFPVLESGIQVRKVV